MDRTARPSVDAGKAAASGRADQQVPAVAETIEDSVEIALALAITLRFGETRVAAMLVLADRQAGETDGAPVCLPFAAVAQDQAPPDVQVPVEAEPLVEWSPLREVGTPERLAIALDRIDVTRGRVLECAEVTRHDPPPAYHRHLHVVQRPNQGRDDIPGRLDARIQQDRDASPGAAQADVRGRGVAEPLAAPDQPRRHLVRCSGRDSRQRSLRRLRPSVRND